MFVKEAMSTKVETVAPDTTIQECAQKMRDLNIGALPVWEDGQFIGMVTDRDICCQIVGDSRDPATIAAREIMSTDATYCWVDQDCSEAAHLMEDKHLRRLAVLNREREMVGFLSVDDLARFSHDLAGKVLEASAPARH